MKSIKNIIKNNKGFTLVELLVVIAILGILAAGLLVAINPIDRINAANDSRVKSDIGTIARTLEAFAAEHDGVYPVDASTELVGDALKRYPTSPYSTGYTYTPGPATCDNGANGNCTSYIVAGEVKSTKDKGACTGTCYFKVDSATGTSCVEATSNDGC